MNQKQIDEFSNKIFTIHNSQNLIFLFRLFKLYSLTQDQFDQLDKAQRRKYRDLHEIRQQANITYSRIRKIKEKFDQKKQESTDDKVKDQELEDFEQEEMKKEQQQRKEGQERDSKTLSEMNNIYRMRSELKEVIWTIVNLHTNHIENVFLYHIFMNKQFNRLIQIGYDRDSDFSDSHAFSQAYTSIDRTKVTAEQMCVILQILSMNPKFENMQNIFEGELESILSIIREREINYSLGKFLIRIGLNHLEEVDRKDVQVSSLQSLTFNSIQNQQICLDSMTLSLYLFDLKNKKHGVDVSFFQKFNYNDILKKLSLSEIDELIIALKLEEQEAPVQSHKEIVSQIINQIIANSNTQAENFKIYNEVLLNQLRLIIKYREYADLSALAQVLNQVSSEIINQSSGKTILSNAFTNYIVEFLKICPSDLIDFYQLFEAFFFKQTIEGISYKQLLSIYKQMANTGVDYEEYLEICHQVFSMNKHSIIQEKLHFEIIPLTEILHDTQTANIFGVTVQPKQRLPEGVEFLSDFSESEGEEEKGEQQTEEKKEN